MSPTDVIQLLSTRRFPLSSEKELQAEIAKALSAAGMEYKREYRLSEADVIDFMLPDGIGIEVKLRQQRSGILRQCERYCAHETLQGLILVSASAMGLPPEIKGKPCWMVSLGRAWL